MKILIIDDDPTVYLVINGILIKNGYETAHASSVSEAIKILQADLSIGLIICDIMMPEADGFDFLKGISNNPVHNNTPVLMCSSLSDKEAILKSMKLGARDYIVKPIEPNTLIKKILKIFEKKDSMTVMVVDDQKFILDILKKILERDGYAVVAYTSAREALKMLGEINVDIIISDISMPEMDGLEFLAQVKKQYPKIRMLMITGHSGKYKEESVIDAGADGFIAKPFKNLEIIRELQGLKLEKI